MSELTDITVTELRQAYNKLDWRISAVDTLVREIRQAREPEWKTGDIVVSDGGTTFIKLINGWKIPYTDKVVDYAFPVRPLRKIGTTG